MDRPFKQKSHSRHITDYHSFFFYEFEIFNELRECSLEDILLKFIKSYFFTDEFRKYQKESRRENITHDAFLINKLAIDDFKRIDGKDVKKVLFLELNNDESGEEIAEYLKDLKSNFSKSKLLLDYFNIDDDETFYLNMNWFTESDKLIEVHWIYVYLLTFISINLDKSRLLLFDYAFD